MNELNERAQYFAALQGYLVDGARTLFAEHGLQMEYTPMGIAVLDGPGVMAVIGYASDEMRGALLLLSSAEVVDALRPPSTRRSDVDEVDVLRDVLGEFANMLLGRMKNRIADRSLVPLISTPTTVYGADLKLPTPTSGMSAWHAFATEDRRIFARFDATFEPDFVLAPAGTNEAAMAEGEMVMFDLLEVCE